MARVVTLFFPVFLIFVHSNALANQVDPPTNLNLDCGNLHNTLTWSYDKQPPGLQFKVLVRYISGGPDTLWVKPPSLQADLSSFSESDQDYYVTVTAVVEGTESASPKGIFFSYFKDSLASQKCSVDLPLVNVTAPKRDIIKFSFVHPWLFHNQNSAGSVKLGAKKRRSHDPQLPEFEYSVMLTNQTEQHHSFICVTSVCEETIPVDASLEQHCLEISGEMKRMSVKAMQNYYCAAPFKEKPTGNYYYIYIIVACVLTGIILVIIYMVVVKKTKASSSLPNSMHSVGHHGHPTLTIDTTQAVASEVAIRSPTPLLSATDAIEDTPFSAPELNCRYPIGVPAENEGPDEESEYMHGGNLEDGETLDNEEIHSGYETRPVLVRLGSDELAQGYRG
ncbi:uncharacterized protein LOC141795100 [Halichoeres trimaculatus]|uniref:uncharacterized protein LOC141795100 n=1 Tax=Halichoeres trimaculatus TaxID=147232 RepID=UPI003D9E0E45